jgi:hypothetical protein
MRWSGCGETSLGLRLESDVNILAQIDNGETLDDHGWGVAPNEGYNEAKAVEVCARGGV